VYYFKEPRKQKEILVQIPRSGGCMTMPYNVLRSAAAAAVLVAGVSSAKGQIHNGIREPVPAGIGQRAAAAEAAFGSVLANALSPESIQATLRIIKAQPDVQGGGVTNFDNVSAP
jgi:hypothetical protein